MKSNFSALLSLTAALLLSACAGPAPKPAPQPPAPPPVVAKPATKFYIITFDASGVPRDRTGRVVDRERVLALIAKGDIDQHTGIRIEAPGTVVDREKNIEAFARAQNVAKIFDLLGFQAVVVALAKQ